MARYPITTPRRHGTYGYKTGTSAGTVDVPTLARLSHVFVWSGSGGSTTITIGGGDTITLPASGTFALELDTDTQGQDVVIGGGVASYFVDYYS